MYPKEITPGPRCKIELWEQGSRWVVGCVTCDWYPDRNFRIKTLAKRYFKDHKHDAPWTYSDDMQKAIDNLTKGEML